jgi:predicted MFS family arabinose efflux permease
MIPPAPSDANQPPEPAQLPSLAYRSWFLLLLVLVSASAVGERYMMAVMVGPIKEELKLSDTQIGLAKDMALALAYIIAVLPLARVADRWSKRKLVAISAAVWSVAVVICGTAKGFGMLLLGRSAIGMGEGGFTPPSQAWIADLFPLKQRASALAIFLFGASLGQFLGPALGGALAQAYGWRHAMMIASIPGFILTPIVWFTLRDTPAGLADRKTPDEAVEAQQGFGETLSMLMKIRTIPLLIGAAALNTMMTLGLVSWAPAFMERTHGMAAGSAGLKMGGALFFGSMLGHFAGGPLSDFLGRRDLRWYIWIMVISGVCVTLVGYRLLTGPGDQVFPLFGLNMFLGGISAAPLMAVIAGLAPAHARSVAVALLMIAINVVGLGAGPLLVGWMSDLLNPTYGQESLGIAMRWSLLVGGPSLILAWLASRTCREDFKRAGGWE